MITKLFATVALTLGLLLVSAPPAYASFEFNPCQSFPWLPQCQATPTPTLTPTPVEEEPTMTPTPTEPYTGGPNVEAYQGPDTTVKCDTSVSNHENYDCPKGTVTVAPAPIEGPRTLSEGPSGTELPNTGSNDLLFIVGGLLMVAGGSWLIWDIRKEKQKVK